MNYLAHAFHVLHDPWLVAGTSLPDWLRLIDRRARAHPRALLSLPLADGSERARLRQGVVRHHEDDLRFHTHPLFEALTAEAVTRLRALSPDPRFRASMLGHIAVEMLLDAALEARHPGTTARYYRALDTIDALALADAARAFTDSLLPAFSELFGRFRRSRFLLLYETDGGVVSALTGLCARAGLPPPPSGTIAVIAGLRPRVHAGADALVGA